MLLITFNSAKKKKNIEDNSDIRGTEEGSWKWFLTCQELSARMPPGWRHLDNVVRMTSLVHFARFASRDPVA